jgi:antirestriction protein ArdC
MNDPVLSKSKFNVYEAVTRKIADAIRQGAGTFTMPWHAAGPGMGIPTNAITEAPYRGVNILSLWVEALTKGYNSCLWASYRQWQERDAQVRNGEHGATIVFFKEVEATEADTDDGNVAPRLVARAFKVFNAAQVDGWTPPHPAHVSDVSPVKEADAFVQATKAEIQHGGAVARYRRIEDCIELPDRQRFMGSATSTSTETYYATLLHELTHWSGASHRLDRQFGKRFGDSAYAVEELVAELGAAFLCAALGIANEPRQDHAAYLTVWLAVLKSDSRAIFTAAGQAQKAVEYLAQLAKSNASPITT